MDFQALLQGIFPAQGLNPRLIMSPALQAGFLPLAPPGKPEHTGKDPNRPQLNGRRGPCGCTGNGRCFQPCIQLRGRPQGRLHSMRLCLGHLSGEAEEQGDYQSPCYNSSLMTRIKLCPLHVWLYILEQVGYHPSASVFLSVKWG